MIKNNEDLSNYISQTLSTYENKSASYIDRTNDRVEGFSQYWIDESLFGLTHYARILEIGSAFGRDAAYISSKGYNIECTDACLAFVEELTSRGFRASPLDIISDPIDGMYDLIIANAVLLHFSKDHVRLVLKKVLDHLSSEGRLAFSLKAGEGEEWSSEKLDSPRYFQYWQPDSIDVVLKETGFSKRKITSTTTRRQHSEWIYIIASA